MINIFNVITWLALNMDIELDVNRCKNIYEIMKRRQALEYDVKFGKVW